MKYAISTNLKFTPLQTTTQKNTENTLKSKQVKQFESDDSHVTSLPNGTLNATLRFDEKDLLTANGLYDTLTTLLSPPTTENQPFVSLHECYHDQQPPKPCMVIKKRQL